MAQQEITSLNDERLLSTKESISRLRQEAMRAAFVQLRTNHQKEWNSVYAKTNKDRDETRRQMKARYLDEYTSIYETKASQLGLTNFKHNKTRSNHITTKLSNNITVTSAKPLSQPDFYLEGHSLLVKDPVPSPLGGFFTNQSRLLFVRTSDGSSLEIHGCNLCLAVFKNTQATAIHIGRVHNGKVSKKMTKKRKYKKDPNAPRWNKADAPSTVTKVKEVVPPSIDPVQAITQLVEQLNIYKDKSEQAEAQLNAIREAFNSIKN